MLYHMKKKVKALRDQSAMKKKICVVEAGYWGKNHIRTLDRLNGLKGIVELDTNILKELLNK